MLIDWFTVGAQVSNFLLLLYLLKRFLYGPILQAMDKRERAIRDRLEAAEKAQVEAEKSATDYQQQRNRLKEQKTQLLAQAEAAAEQRGKELIAQAKAETDGLRSSWAEAVQREQALFFEELKKRLGTEILRISRKSTAELTGVDLQPRLVALLLEKLQDLDKTDKNKCAAAAVNATPQVWSAFALGTPLEKKITAALQELCAIEVPVIYTSDPERPFGIDVIIGELKFSWGVEQYFKELEKNVSALLGQSLQPASPLGAQGDG